MKSNEMKAVLKTKIAPEKLVHSNLAGGWTTHLKNMIVKLGIFPQIGMKIKNIWVATT